MVTKHKKSHYILYKNWEAGFADSLRPVSFFCNVIYVIQNIHFYIYIEMYIDNENENENYEFGL